MKVFFFFGLACSNIAAMLEPYAYFTKESVMTKYKFDNVLLH